LSVVRDWLLCYYGDGWFFLGGLAAVRTVFCVGLARAGLRVYGGVRVFVRRRVGGSCWFMGDCRVV